MPSSSDIQLQIATNQLNLNMPTENDVIDLSITELSKLLSPLPPNEQSWEMAIMRVEDSISYLRDELVDFDELSVIGADALSILAMQGDEKGRFMLAETLEKAFAVLAGYRSTRDLPDLPNTADFYAKVLLLREWVHHLNFDKVYLD